MRATSARPHATETLDIESLYIKQQLESHSNVIHGATGSAVSSRITDHKIEGARNTDNSAVWSNEVILPTREERPS